MATKCLLVLFRLKPGQSVASYEEWATTIDIPTVRRLSSIRDFRVFRCTGLFGEAGEPPCDYAEFIEIEDFAGFMDEIAGETMQRISTQFQAFADISFVEIDELGAAA